jgi:hypothetical protein
MTKYVFSVLATIVLGASLPTFALFYAQTFDTLTKTGDELLGSGRLLALVLVGSASANFVSMFFRIVLMSCSTDVTLARIRSEPPDPSASSTAYLRA